MKEPSRDPDDYCPDCHEELMGGLAPLDSSRPPKRGARATFVIGCPKCGRMFPELAAALTARARSWDAVCTRGRNLDPDQ
jgi:hypothetical protein